MSPWRDRWTLRRRLLWTFVVVGLTTILVAGLGTTALMATVQRTDDLLNRVGPARIAGYELQAALLNQETGVRGYVLTRDPASLTPYTAGQKSETTQLEVLRRAIDGDRRLERDLARVEDRADVWRAQFAEPTIAAVRGGRPVLTERSELGERLFDQLRQSVTTFQQHLAEIREDVRGDLSTATRMLWVIALTALAAIVTAGVVLWRALRRWIIDPLESLGAETRQVVSGDLEHRVSIHGPREILRLAYHVEGMRQSLVEALSAQVSAREKVEAQARQLEEQTHQLEAQTYQLELQTEQLEAQTTDLRRSNAELEQFAYVASHDLQEPLRKVASFCQLLARRYSGQLDERGEQYIAFAVDGAKRMQLLINDLLAFSRVGRTTGEFQEVELDAALGRAITSLATAIEETDAEIDADPLPTVIGNPTLLTQVFQNLIGNATKFRGEVPPRIRLTVEQKDDVYEFACSDNGIGIAPQYAERVFVIFQRLHGKDEYAGTGIGLALCRKIIEHHGGRIWLDTDAESASGGTTFRWTLPVPSAADRERTGTARTENAP